jgi:putative hydrolase of the HAD superfamily
MHGMDWSSIEAVVFDIGGVFLLPHPEPIRAALVAGGFDRIRADDECYHRAHYRAVRVLADLDIPEHDPAFWRTYEVTYLREIGAAEEDIEIALKAWTSTRDLEVIKFWRWVQQHNVDALARFAGAGFPMAIVSNNDGTATEQMRLFNVCQVGPGPLAEVACIVDSGTVGCAKPDPAIFGHALDVLGTRAEQTLYVGDMVHADVRGARAAGMPVAQIDPYDFHEGFDHVRVPHLDALVDRLLAARS